MQQGTGTVARSNQSFDMKQQIGRRPWLALGMAVAAGYALGAMRGDDGAGSDVRFDWTSPTTRDFADRVAYAPPPRQSQPFARNQQSSRDLLAPVCGEIDELTATAVSTIKTMLRDLVRDYTPNTQARRSDRLTDQPWPNLEQDREYVKTYHLPSDQHGA
jgi:hypothetical protein